MLEKEIELTEEQRARAVVIRVVDQTMQAPSFEDMNEFMKFNIERQNKIDELLGKLKAGELDLSELEAPQKNKDVVRYPIFAFFCRIFQIFRFFENFGFFGVFEFF